MNDLPMHSVASQDCPYSVVVRGPQGCGKTRSAPALQSFFGLEHLLDGWDGRTAFDPGTLVLTCEKTVVLPPHARLIDFADLAGVPGVAISAPRISAA